MLVLQGHCPLVSLLTRWVTLYLNSKYLESVLEAELDLLADECVALAQDVPPLRVAQDDPLAAHVLDHAGADPAREGPIGRLVAVLQDKG